MWPVSIYPGAQTSIVCVTINKKQVTQPKFWPGAAGFCTGKRAEMQEAEFNYEKMAVIVIGYNDHVVVREACNSGTSSRKPGCLPWALILSAFSESHCTFRNGNYGSGTDIL